MVTMQQIAEKCGVSRGTVDRALHHKAGVRESVAQHIRDTAREMGYLPSQLMTGQKQWKIGVILHSSQSAFVKTLFTLLTTFPERELISNISIVIRTMEDVDVHHQITLIDELVHTEQIHGLALMPLANTLIRDKINDLAEVHHIPVVTFNTDISDANRLAYVGPDNVASGCAAAALMGILLGGSGDVLPILGQRSGHFADSQRLTGFISEISSSFPNIHILRPECTFLDNALSERITLRAISSNPNLKGIYVSSAGREGVYRALTQKNHPHIKVIVHDITPDNIKMVHDGIVDFIIGQDEKTQGSLPIRILYDYLERHRFPESRVYTTETMIKFRCNI